MGMVVSIAGAAMHRISSSSHLLLELFQAAMTVRRCSVNVSNSEWEGPLSQHFEAPAIFTALLEPHSQLCYCDWLTFRTSLIAGFIWCWWVFLFQSETFCKYQSGWRWCWRQRRFALIKIKQSKDLLKCYCVCVPEAIAFLHSASEEKSGSPADLIPMSGLWMAWPRFPPGDGRGIDHH